MLYVIQRAVTHPGTMEEIIPVGSIITEDDFVDLAAELGIDEILATVCYNELAAETIAKRLSQ